MKIFLSFLVLISFAFGYSQEFSKSDFVKTDWFISNENGGFMKNDTLKFIQYSNYALNRKYSKYMENEFDYLGQGYFVEIDFKSGRRMNFRGRIDNYIQKLDTLKYKWKFDKKKSIISIYKEDKIMMKIKPIERKKVEIKSRFARNKLLETNEITFIRIK